MISFDHTGIVEIRQDDTFVVTTTISVESPVAGAFYIEADGGTIPEAVDKLMAYIKKNSDEDAYTLKKIREVLLHLMKEGERVIKSDPLFSSSFCKATWTGTDAKTFGWVSPDDPLG